MALSKEQLKLMAEINSDPTYDDGNHSDKTRQIARTLFRSGMIQAIPIVDSDTAVDHLTLTDIGQLALRWHGPTSEDDAVVDWYALRIKQKLAKRSTDSNKGILKWRTGNNSLSRLHNRFVMEVGELSEALFRLDENEGTLQERLEGIIDEAVDCGAVAMMVADFAKMVQDDAL